MNADTEARIRLMKSSLRCFVFGLLGLIPLIGLPFALAALWISGQVRAKEKQIWNAAQPYRVWGAISAAAGTVLWTGVLMIVIARLLMIAQGLG